MKGRSRAGLRRVRGASFGDVPSPVRRLALGTGLSASRRPRTSALAASTVVCSPQLLRRGQDQADRSGQGAPLKKLGSLLLPPSCLRPGCRPRGRPGVGSEEAGAAAVGACDQRGRRPSGGGRLKARGLGSGSGGCGSWRPGRWQGPTPGYPRAVSRTGLRGRYRPAAHGRPHHSVRARRLQRGFFLSGRGGVRAWFRLYSTAGRFRWRDVPSLGWSCPGLPMTGARAR